MACGGAIVRCGGVGGLVLLCLVEVTMVGFRTYGGWWRRKRIWVRGFSVGGKANLVAYNIDFQMLVIANEKL